MVSSIWNERSGRHNDKTNGSNVWARVQNTQQKTNQLNRNGTFVITELEIV